MPKDQKTRLLIVTSYLRNDPEWVLAPIVQLAVFLTEQATDPNLVIDGVYELEPKSGMPRRVDYKVGPASGREDINPKDRLVSVFFSNGEIEEWGFQIP